LELSTKQTAEVQASPRAIRINQVIARTGLSRTTIHREVKAGNFPNPISISKRSKAWIEREVDAWLNAKISERAA